MEKYGKQLTESYTLLKKYDHDRKKMLNYCWNKKKYLTNLLVENVMKYII